MGNLLGTPGKQSLKKETDVLWCVKKMIYKNSDITKIIRQYEYSQKENLP